MKNLPLVSVIMNCHNGEKYLKEAVKSLISQTFNKWELIFWDNKSLDNSAKIIKRFKEKRIRYFKSKKFSSLYEARNLAVKKAKGKFIAFLDVDDLWEKDKLEKQVNYFKNNKEIKFVYSNFFLINKKKNIKRIGYNYELPSGLVTQKILNTYSVGIVTVMMDKQIFNKYKFNNKYNIIGDFDLFIKISQKYRFGCIQLPLASYRVHSSNFSIKRIDLHIKELKNWIKTNKKRLKGLSYSTKSITKSLIILKIKYYLKFLGV